MIYLSFVAVFFYKKSKWFWHEIAFNLDSRCPIRGLSNDTITRIAQPYSKAEIRAFLCEGLHNIHSPGPLKLERVFVATGGTRHFANTAPPFVGAVDHQALIEDEK